MRIRRIVSAASGFTQAIHDALVPGHHSNALDHSNVNDHVASHTLASHSAKAHSDLTGITATDHHSNANDHAALHAASHADAGSDEIVDGTPAPSTQAFGDAAAAGATLTKASPVAHKHGMPADPRPTIAQAAPAQALGTADTYVTNSAITIPAGLRVGTILRWRIFITKTAAGVVAPIVQIRFGTNGTTADTSRVSITGNAQTAAIDSGCFEVVCIVTAIGATGNVLGMIFLNHQLATTGLSLGNWGQQALSANFDLTVANLKAGISITPGASAAWTVNRVVTQIEP